MAQKVYEMALALAGKLDSSFNSTFATAARSVNKLDSQLKELNAAQKKLGQYKALSARIGQTSGQFDAAREKTKLLAAELLKTEEPTQKLINQFEKARTKTDKLKGKLSEQRSQLKSLDKELSGAGISTRKLIDENSRLTKEVDKVTAAKKKQVIISKTLNQVQSKTSALVASTHSKVQSASAGVGVAAVGGGGIVSAGIGYSLKIAADSQLQLTTMEALLKDQKRAQDYMNWAIKESADTTFKDPEMMTTALSLAPYARDNFNLFQEYVKTAEVLAAINPLEGLEGGAFALREALSGDFVSLQERFNLPRSVINDLKKGATTAEDYLKVVQKAAQSLGYDYDLVKKQGKTAIGLWNIITGNFGTMSRKFGDGILKSAVPGLQKLVDLLNENKDGVKSIQDRLESLGQTIGTSVVSKFEKLYNWILTLENDEKFKNMNWGDKFIFVIDQGLTALDAWIVGDGKGKLDGIISKIAEIAAESWFKAESKLLTQGGQNIYEGNYAAGAGELFMANKLSGNLLGLGAMYLGGKGLGWFGSKAITILSGAGKAAGATDAVALLASLQGGGGAAAGTAGAAGILAPVAGTTAYGMWALANMSLAGQAKQKGDTFGEIINLYSAVNPLAFPMARQYQYYLDTFHPAPQTASSEVPVNAQGSSAGAAAGTGAAIEAITRGGQEQNKLTGQVEAGTQAMELYAKIAGQGADNQNITNLSLLNLTGASNMATMALLNLRWNAINAGTIPGHATGTRNWGGGLTWINERGGEIIDLPRGSRIYPADKSEKMMGGEGGLVYAPQVTIHGNASKADMNAVMNANFHQFTRWFEEYQDDKRRREY